MQLVEEKRRKETRTSKEEPSLWTQLDVTSTWCAGESLPSSAFQSCFLPVLSLCHQAMPKGQASLPPPGHNPPTWAWQECLHTICSMRGKERAPACRETTQNGEVTVGSAPRAGPSAAQHLNSSWSMVPHLPGLSDDSQASQNQSETVFIWWAEDEGLFSPGTVSILTVVCRFCIHHHYRAHSHTAYKTITPCRLHRDIADCKAQSQEYCIGILQIARYNLFFP